MKIRWWQRLLLIVVRAIIAILVINYFIRRHALHGRIRHCAAVLRK